MRLKIRRLLKAGIYSISFEVVGFDSKENKQFRKRGVPAVDLSDLSLGTFRLDRFNCQVRCRNAREANEIIQSVKQKTKERLSEFLVQSKSIRFEKKPRFSKWSKVPILAMACVMVFLLLTAYKGVIPSQQTGVQQMQSDSPVLADVNGETTTATIQPSSHDVLAYSEADLDHRQSALASTSAQSGKTECRFSSITKPNFNLAVVPELLTRYSSWDLDESESAGEFPSHNFKLILTPSGGFEGPVTLSVRGGALPIKTRLYPKRIDKLPGSSTLIISVPSESPPQLCPEITILVRGQTADGVLITHEEKVSVAICQRSYYKGPIWHVSVQGSDQSGDGSYGSPFRTIQRAVDCTQAGDTVLVDEGLYLENISLIDKERILIASRYIFDQEESIITSTIIEAKEPGWVVTIGRGNDIILQGFTIQKGKASNGSLGGGIYCYDSQVNVLDNVITDNQNHSGYGAGIYCYGSQPTIMRNRITKNRNREGHGAGIYCYRSDPDIHQNVISGNCAGGGGSAIHILEPANGSIVGNLIHNQSGSVSVVLYNKGRGADFRIINNTISHNQGDAIRFFGGPWYMQNNIITQNEGYGLYTLDGTAYLLYNNLWANVHGIDTTDYYGFDQSPTGTYGNISRNPRFGNPVHGNFLLCFDSPCIDAGNPSDPIPPGGSYKIDMGAFEYTFPEMMCGDVNRDGAIDYGDIDCLSGYIGGRTQIVDPFETGDVNHDNEIDKRDLTALYESIYFYGPDPCGSYKPQDRLTNR